MGRKLFTLIVAGLFFYTTSPLILPLAMGGVFAVLFWPLLERMEKKKFSTVLGSAILTLAITLVLLIPTALLIYLGAKTGVQQLQAWHESSDTDSGLLSAITDSPRIQRVMDWITDWFPVSQKQLLDTFHDLSKSLGAKGAELLGGLITHLPGMAMGLAVIVVSLFFFLVDGRKLVLFIRRNSFFSPHQTEHLLLALAGMCRSVILASVVSGATQAVFEGMVCLFAGVPNAALIGMLVFLGSFIPLLGSAPVTIGVAVHQLLLGNTSAGVILMIAAAFVSVMDNLIRPWFLKGSGNIHPLLAFVAAFGGIQTLGFVGVFLGPIIAALFIVTLQILVQSSNERA